ncbi:hypothetical protein LDENG_00097640 [Lucifuga dentata]|nr:hypothetical protein LDENG_00097640 [Lucifuga dentata]
MITLEINLCTAQWAGFNPSDLALNGEHNNSECRGTMDTSVDPPVIRYLLPVNHSQENPCRQSLQDSDCNYPLVVPSTGLQLRTRVHVEVKAINLTGNFYVLLDHCFATATAYNVTHSEQHNFLTSCSVDQRTIVTSNGVSNTARFDFETFRFVQHRDQDKSTIYLHCILRLCEPTKCQALLAACNNRKKRSLTPYLVEGRESATVSAGPIYIAGEETPTAAAYGSEVPSGRSDTNVTGLVVGVVFGSAAAVLLVLGGWFFLKKLYWVGALPHVFN